MIIRTQLKTRKNNLAKGRRQKRAGIPQIARLTLLWIRSKIGLYLPRMEMTNLPKEVKL
jgi:hypothetical protein